MDITVKSSAKPFALLTEEEQTFGLAAAAQTERVGWVYQPCMPYGNDRHNTTQPNEDQLTVPYRHYHSINYKSHHNGRRTQMLYTTQQDRRQMIQTKIHKLEHQSQVNQLN